MATPTEQIQTSIPSWLKDPILKLIGQADVLSQQGYQPYARPKLDAQGKPVMDDQGRPVMESIQRLEDFSPLQKQAFQNIAGMQTADQLRQATGLAGLAGVDAARLGQYTPAAEREFYQAPQFERMGTTFQQVNAAPGTSYQMAGPERVGLGALQQYQMGPAERVSADQFGLGATSQYMSPYMQEVVDRQKQAAIRDYARQLPGLKAAGVRSGASGGTREAILESEARRNLATQLGDIQAQGSQAAYQQAQAQYNADRARMLQAGLANQQAGLSTGQQNLAALLGVQQLGTQSGLQAALANQAAQQQTGQTNLQAMINQQQFGSGQGLQAQQLNQAAQLQAQQQALAQLAQANQFSQQNAQQRAQYGLSGANLAEQSRQFGAGLGMQGLQQQLAAAGMLGNLGQQEYQQQMGINAAQLGAGGQQQAFGQELLNTQYQDFLNQQRLPYQQMEFMSGILRGLPATGQTQTMYQAPGSMFGQIAGVGLGLGSLFGGLGSTTGK
jgi:hypothetical protein